jgi:hypothetical protein
LHCKYHTTTSHTELEDQPLLPSHQYLYKDQYCPAPLYKKNSAVPSTCGLSVANVVRGIGGFICGHNVQNAITGVAEAVAHGELLQLGVGGDGQIHDALREYIHS